MDEKETIIMRFERTTQWGSYTFEPNIDYPVNADVAASIQRQRDKVSSRRKAEETLRPVTLSPTEIVATEPSSTMQGITEETVAQMVQDGVRQHLARLEAEKFAEEMRDSRTNLDESGDKNESATTAESGSGKPLTNVPPDRPATAGVKFVKPG